ncbi:hypothetical protein NPIL_106921 [Nephila pilipes]|uniref:Secreted protein n=1 Tax=Nephila pilipes TaxID=299642 RepID=A0A8X6Q8Y5_NEPPI|nr:hypothetical protein NPIL_106921 [Nephila pilipes]
MQGGGHLLALTVLLCRRAPRGAPGDLCKGGEGIPFVKLRVKPKMGIGFQELRSPFVPHLPNDSFVRAQRVEDRFFFFSFGGRISQMAVWVQMMGVAVIITPTITALSTCVKNTIFFFF